MREHHHAVRAWSEDVQGETGAIQAARSRFREHCMKCHCGEVFKSPRWATTRALHRTHRAKLLADAMAAAAAHRAYAWGDRE
jgi:hypothetical protein